MNINHIKTEKLDASIQSLELDIRDRLKAVGYHRERLSEEEAAMIDFKKAHVRLLAIQRKKLEKTGAALEKSA